MKIQLESVAQGLHRRSVTLVDQLERGHRPMILYWTMAASFACGIRLSLGSFFHLPLPAQLSAGLPYVLVVAAPIISVALALRWFRNGDRLPKPRRSFACFGCWREVGAAEARLHPLYGVTGLMASLMLGMLLNVPVRTLEFLTAIPALGAAPPAWFGTLYTLMLADVVLLSSLYAVAFVAALRRVPSFPRLLAVIWGVDILMQIAVARIMGAVADLPPAVGVALHQLLEGNLDKVLISVALWAPYLLMSKRVNVTFRHRLPA